MKTQKEIVNDVKWYYEYEVKKLKEARKKYYLEDNLFKRDIWYDDFRMIRYCVMALAQILGIYDNVTDKYKIIFVR